MTLPEAIGWSACAADGTPITKTVSETATAAMVNWIHADGGVPIMRSMSEQHIANLWNMLAAPKGFTIREVRIVPVESSP